MKPSATLSCTCIESSTPSPPCCSHMCRCQERHLCVAQGTAVTSLWSTSSIFLLLGADFHPYPDCYSSKHWHVTSTTDFTATRTHPSPLSSTCRRFLKKTLKCSLSSSNIGLSLDHTNKSQNIFGISFSLFHFRHIYFKLEIYARCQIRIKKDKQIYIYIYIYEGRNNRQ